jgi:hypothetical protein
MKCIQCFYKVIVIWKKDKKKNQGKDGPIYGSMKR